ncbi:MAG: EamA family transporter [Rhizobiales bacterium]|nr:EamA family transporter [Hyphomicrobiales bacterium]
MDPTVFAAVLVAAGMHAGWNVLVKLNLDRFLSLFLIQTLMGGLGLVMLAVFPLAAAASLPYALTSGVLHLGYNLVLARSYRTGDLSQVYPIARGAAPLLTLLVAWFAAHERIGGWGALGIGVLVAGIWLVSFAGRKAVKLDGLTLFFALGTSVFIAAYTVVDGLGGRVSGSPSSYAGLVFVFDALFLLAYALVFSGPGVIAAVLPYWRTGTVGAVLSAGAYWIAIWGMAHAQIAAVAALRETSILFVMLMSMRVLKETVTVPRIGGAALIVVGAVMLRLA